MFPETVSLCFSLVGPSSHVSLRYDVRSHQCLPLLGNALPCLFTFLPSSTTRVMSAGRGFRGEPTIVEPRHQAPSAPAVVMLNGDQ